MTKNVYTIKSLDEIARLTGGYVKQSLPSDEPDRDQMITEAIAKRKGKHNTTKIRL